LSIKNSSFTIFFPCRGHLSAGMGLSEGIHPLTLPSWTVPSPDPPYQLGLNPAFCGAWWPPTVGVYPPTKSPCPPLVGNGFLRHRVTLVYFRQKLEGFSVFNDHKVANTYGNSPLTLLYSYSIHLLSSIHLSPHWCARRDEFQSYPPSYCHRKYP